MTHCFRFVKKRRSYEKNNLTFSVDTGFAYSYRWYCIAKPIAGTMVVNSFSYSRTTKRHYEEILRLVVKLGYEKILTIEAPRGLNSQGAISAHYADMIMSLEKDIAKPRSRESTNKKRRENIEHLKARYSSYMKLVNEEEFDEQMSILLADHGD